MMVHIPNVLAPEQVARCRDVMLKAAWVDGRVTAGHQSEKVKNNLQLPETAPEARELGDMVMAALGRNPLFLSAGAPAAGSPPPFHRLDAREAAAPPRVPTDAGPIYTTPHVTFRRPPPP